MTYIEDTDPTYTNDDLYTLRTMGFDFPDAESIPHGFNPVIRQAVIFGKAHGTWRRYHVVADVELDKHLDAAERHGWTDLAWCAVDSRDWHGKSLCEQNGYEFCDDHVPATVLAIRNRPARQRRTAVEFLRGHLGIGCRR